MKTVFHRVKIRNRVRVRASVTSQALFQSYLAQRERPAANEQNAAVCAETVYPRYLILPLFEYLPRPQRLRCTQAQSCRSSGTFGHSRISLCTKTTSSVSNYQFQCPPKLCMTVLTKIWFTSKPPTAHAMKMEHLSSAEVPRRLLDVENVTAFLRIQPFRACRQHHTGRLSFCIGVE